MEGGLKKLGTLDNLIMYKVVLQIVKQLHSNKFRSVYDELKVRVRVPPILPARCWPRSTATFSKTSTLTRPCRRNRSPRCAGARGSPRWRVR